MPKFDIGKKQLVVAMDHGRAMGAVAGLEDPGKVIESCEKLHLVRRLGQPAEIAKVIAFLASADASFMTGHPVVVDGGAMVPIGGAAFLESGTRSAV